MPAPQNLWLFWNLATHTRCILGECVIWHMSIQLMPIVHTASYRLKKYFMCSRLDVPIQGANVIWLLLFWTVDMYECWDIRQWPDKLTCFTKNVLIGTFNTNTHHFAGLHKKQKSWSPNKVPTSFSEYFHNMLRSQTAEFFHCKLLHQNHIKFVVIAMVNRFTHREKVNPCGA